MLRSRHLQTVKLAPTSQTGETHNPHCGRGQLPPLFPTLMRTQLDTASSLQPQSDTGPLQLRAGLPPSPPPGPAPLTLACWRMAWAWDSWAETMGPLEPASPPPPKRNCRRKTRVTRGPQASDVTQSPDPHPLCLWISAPGSPRDLLLTLVTANQHSLGKAPGSTLVSPAWS